LVIVQVQAAMNEHDWATAVTLRGRSFARNLDTYKLLTKMKPPQEKDNLSLGRKFNVAVMNVGAPAGGMCVWVSSQLNTCTGMNAAIRSFTRVAMYHNCHVFGVKDSFEGLAAGTLEVWTLNTHVFAT
jgi:6-phosphofructokinase 1